MSVTPAVADGELFVPYRLRTVRIGVVAQLAAVSVLVFVPFLGVDDGWRLDWYWGALAVGFAGVLAIAALPWPRIFAAGYGLAVMYAWSVADILLITTLVVASGGASSPMWAVFALTSIFFAASYPPRGQLALLGFTIAAYVLGLALVDDLRFDGLLTTRVAVLAILTYMASFLSRELMTQMVGHDRQRELSQRRAEHVAAVADAARRIHDLDDEVVLSEVITAAANLGYETAGVARLDDGEATIVEAIGLPEDFKGRAYPVVGGPIEEMLSTETCVVSEMDPDRPLGRLGFGTLIAAPIRVGGTTAAFLAVAARRRPRPDDELAVEPLALLAEVAGRALENVSAFADERAAVERLRQLDALKSDFISNASHELRTPATVLYGLTQTLSRRGDQLDDATKQHLVRRLSAAAESLQQTVTTLMDFARIETGQLDARPSPVSIAELVDTVVENLAETLAAHHLSVDVARDLTVVVDPVLLERAVENLLVNASRYTPPGTAVRVRARQDGAEARVTVADDGPGVPPEELPNLTDRFFRGGDANTRPTRGLGLGLAFVSDVAAAHGGRLDVQSVYGSGSSFTLVLPVSEHETGHPTVTA